MSAQEPLSNPAAAVLGMVVLGARTGYEIRRAVERSVRFFWALGPPQVYAELKRLEARGLVEGRDDPQGERNRRVHVATAAGERALQAWLGDAAEPAPIELRDLELLRLFFSDAAGPDAAHARVAAMRRRSEQALELFRTTIEPAAARTREQGAPAPEHVARFGRELHEFIIGWCDRFEADTEAEAGP